MHVMDSYSDYLGEIEYIASMEEERLAYLRADRPKLPVGLWDVEVWRIRPVAHGLEVMVSAMYYNPSEPSSSSASWPKNALHRCSGVSLDLLVARW